MPPFLQEQCFSETPCQCHHFTRVVFQRKPTSMPLFLQEMCFSKNTMSMPPFSQEQSFSENPVSVPPFLQELSFSENPMSMAPFLQEQCFSENPHVNVTILTRVEVIRFFKWPLWMPQWRSDQYIFHLGPATYCYNGPCGCHDGGQISIIFIQDPLQTVIVICPYQYKYPYNKQPDFKMTTQAAMQRMADHHCNKFS